MFMLRKFSAEQTSGQTFIEDFYLTKIPRGVKTYQLIQIKKGNLF